MKKLSGFVWTDILIVVAIVLIVLVVVVLAINPVKMISKSHDIQRLADFTQLTTGLNLFLADNKNFNGLTGPYLSTAVDDKNRTKTNGTGWIPVKFNTISSGVPLPSLPFDSINNGTYHYTVGVNTVNNTYEINCVFENADNFSKMSSDGGNNPDVYEVGTDLTILP